MSTKDTKGSNSWKIVIFMVNGKANHVGLSTPFNSLADLSLLGARIVSWDAPSLPKGERIYFDIKVPNQESAMAYLRLPGLLMSSIIEKERAYKGWHLTEDASDYVRNYRSFRSRNPDDMNCVEWIAYALELGGFEFPDDVLTPSELLNWCWARYTGSEE